MLVKNVHYPGTFETAARSVGVSLRDFVTKGRGYRFRLKPQPDSDTYRRLDPQAFDLASLIDESLTFSENRENLRRTIGL